MESTNNSKPESNEPEIIDVQPIVTDSGVATNEPESSHNDSSDNSSTEPSAASSKTSQDIFEQVSTTYYKSAKQTTPNQGTSPKVTATAESTYDPVNVIPDMLPLDGENPPASQSQKIKGAAQMAAGGALAVAGVPLLILPGPGAVFIVGGVALASKGQRNFSGRSASPLESKLDSAAAKMAQVAKDQAKQAAQNAAKEAPRVAKNAAQQIPVVTKKAAEAAPVVAKKIVGNAPVVAKKVADTAPVVAKKVIDSAPVVAEKVAQHAPGAANKVVQGAGIVANTAIKAAPIVAEKVAQNAPKVAEKVAKTTPEIAGKVIARAPVVANTVAKGFAKGISVGANLLKQAGSKATETTSKEKNS